MLRCHGSGSFSFMIVQGKLRRERSVVYIVDVMIGKLWIGPTTSQFYRLHDHRNVVFIELFAGDDRCELSCVFKQWLYIAIFFRSIIENLC